MGALLGGGALLLGALQAQQSNDAVKRNRGRSTDPLVHLIRLSVLNEERSSSCIHQMLRVYALKKSQTWLQSERPKLTQSFFKPNLKEDAKIISIMARKNALHFQPPQKRMSVTFQTDNFNSIFCFSNACEKFSARTPR